MEEIFELIKAFNRLKEKIVELIAKIDLLLKSPPVGRQTYTDATAHVSEKGYVDEYGACRILHVCPRTLAKMRADSSIPYFRSRKKIMYKVSDLSDYLKRNTG